MKPNILIIGNTVEDCIKISQLYDNYATIIDYETDILEIYNIDYSIYNIIIFYTNEDIIEKYFINNFIFYQKTLNIVKILLTSDISEQNLSKQIKNNFDMICSKELDNDKIKFMISIYNFIKYNYLYKY